MSPLKEARRLFNGPFVVLDTETTGLGGDAEVCEIAVVDGSGATLLDALVKPSAPIEPATSAIHGITDADVADAAPAGAFLSECLSMLLSSPQVAVASYNTAFDLRLLDQTVGGDAWRRRENTVCLMEMYSAFYGDKDGANGYRWQSLANAAFDCGVEVVAQHRALGDARTAWAILRFMATRGKGG